MNKNTLNKTIVILSLSSFSAFAADMTCLASKPHHELNSPNCCGNDYRPSGCSSRHWDSANNEQSWNQHGNQDQGDVDNTARNSRDADGDNPTPLNQGNNDQDTRITRQIRQRVLAMDNLSVYAQNVKIITNNGRVVLRGPVKSIDERQAIGRIADKVAGRQNVNNELEVKSEATNS